ncbi:glycosyltransferase family 2 protein [Nocardioides zeicaulis]
MVPHYGAPGPTLDVCAQLLAQRDVDLEVVVADDASPEPIVVPDGVRLVRRDVNGGFAANVNSGLAEARGALCLVLNSDMQLRDRAVADLVEAARPHQPCLAAPAITTVDGRWEESRHRWPSPLRTAVSLSRPVPHLTRIPRVRRWLLESRAVATEGPTPCDWVSGAAFMVPTPVIRSIGGLDEHFFMYGEDVDLQRRLRAAGVPSLLFRSVEMAHVGGGSTDPLRADGWSLQARWVYAERHGYARRLRAMLWGTALVNVLWNVAARAGGRKVSVRRELRHDVLRARGRTY